MFIEVVEVCEIGVDLQHPIPLSQNHSANVDPTGGTAQERLVLHPCNDIMQAPRCDEYRSCRREIPTKDWCVEKDEETIRYREDKLLDSVLE
jgi:hypothetical protein